MKFFTCVPGRRGSSGGPRFFVVDAESAFDARDFALRELGSEGLIVHPTGEDAVASVELSWVGTDAGAHPDRHLEIRRRKVVYAREVGAWGEWQRA